MKWLNLANLVIGKINKAVVLIAGGFVVVLTVVVCYDVAVRYLFNKPTVWATEISGYMLLFIAFIAAGYTLQIDGHVNCDIIIVRLKPKARRIVFYVGIPFSLLFCGVFAWQVYRLFSLALRENPLAISVLSTPLKYPYSVMLIGAILLLLTFLFKTLLALSKPAGPQS